MKDKTPAFRHSNNLPSVECVNSESIKDVPSSSVATYLALNPTDHAYRGIDQPNLSSGPAQDCNIPPSILPLSLSPLFPPNEIADRNRNLTTRAAIRYQIFRAAPRIAASGQILPGNGMAPAIYRRGRKVLIHEGLWLAWMIGRDISTMNFEEAEQLASSLRTKKYVD